MNRRNNHKSTSPAEGRSDHSNQTTQTIQTTYPNPTTQRSLAAVAVIILTAVFAALAVWVIAVPIAGAELSVGGMSVSPAAVALVSLGSGCAAGISYLIARRLRGGPVIWTVLGCIVLVLSMAGPLLSGATGSVLVTLEAMHVIVGGTMMLGLLLFVPRRMGRASDLGSAASAHGSAASVSTPSTAVSE